MRQSTFKVVLGLTAERSRKRWSVQGLPLEERVRFLGRYKKKANVPAARKSRLDGGRKVNEAVTIVPGKTSTRGLSINKVVDRLNNRKGEKRNYVPN